MRFLIVALFALLAGLAWLADDRPLGSAPQGRVLPCVDWIDGQWQEVRCP